MKDNRGKLLAAFAVLAMVVCAFVAIAPASEGASDATPVKDATELKSAIATENFNIVLTASITVSERLVIDKSGTLDISTFNLTSDSQTDSTVIFVNPGKTVTIKGTGTISSANISDNRGIIAADGEAGGTGSNVTIDGPTIKSNNYGISVWDSATLIVNNATITSKYSAISGNGTQCEVSVTIKNGTFTSTDTAAVYFPSTSNLTITGGKFVGKMGIEVRAGTVNISGAEINASTGSTANNKTGTDGPLEYGMAVAIIDHASYAIGKDISVTVSDNVKLTAAENSYKIYVGNINGASGDTGAFDATFSNPWTPEHNISLTANGSTYTYVDGTVAPRFTAVIMEQDASQDDILNGLDNSDVAITNDLTITVGSAIDKTDKSIVLGDNVLTITPAADAKDVTISLSVTGADGSGAVLNTVKLNPGDTLTIKSGSIEINGTAASENAGTITITGDGVVVGDTDFNGTIALEANSTLTIPEGTTLKVKSITGTSTSKVILNGNLVGYDGATIGSDVKVEITSTGSISGITGGTQTFDPANPQFEFKGMLTHDAVVSNEQSLTGDLYIAEGYSLTILSGGVLNLNGYGIYVEGTLAVDMNGSIKNIGSNTVTKYGNQIILAKNGVIENNGIIGSGTAVKVTAVIPDDAKDKAQTDIPITVPANYTSEGTVTMKDVAGATFSIEKSGSKYVLALTGDLSSYGMSDVYTISAEDVNLVGEISIGQDVVFTSAGAVTLVKDANLTVDGEMKNGANLTMKNGSSMIVYGTVDKVVAETGTYDTADSQKTGLATTAVTLTNVTNVELSVGQYNYSETGADGKTVAKTEQRLYVNGTLALVDETKTGSIALADGKAYVAEEAVLAIDDKMSITGTDIVVLGQIQYVKSDSVKNYIGTQYAVVDSADRTKRTYYITTFDKAFEQIGAAEKNTLTIRGDYTFDKDITLTDGQKIVVLTGYSVNVDEAASVVLERGSSITGNVKKVDGVLTIKAGASCPTPKEYVVMKKGTDFIQYSGLVPAINGAQSGDVIDVRMGTTVKNDMSIPEGVTVNIADGVTLKFLRNLTVEETAVLNNSGTIDMAGEKSRIYVFGELDSAEGAVVFSAAVTGDDVRSLQSTGTTELTSTGYTGVAKFVVGAVYTNEEGTTVITSFAKAAEAVAAQDSPKAIDIVGKLSESGDVAVANGITVTVSGEAVLGGIDLSRNASVVVDGKLSATVSAMTGIDGGTSESSIALNKASGVTVGAYSFTASDNVKTDYLYIYGTLTGEATVESGKVNVGKDGNNNGLEVPAPANNAKQGNLLTVASGATLAVEAVNGVGMELTVGSNTDSAATVVVEGTIVFDRSAYTDTRGVMNVAGTMTVADDTDVTVAGTLNVTGTLNVSVTEDKEGQVSVTGTLTVGSAGTVTGEVVASEIVKAYAGADLEDADIVDSTGAAVNGTQFVINGELYMTAFGGANYSEVIADEKFDLPGLDTSKAKKLSTSSSGVTTYHWFTDADLTDGATDKVLGTDAALYFKAPALTVEVTISVGSGISLYIDNIRYISGEIVDLTVGQHTVSATVNPGYSGTVTVQFNGQTVTGSFTITPEMASAAYDGTISVTATGDIKQDSTVVVNPSESGGDEGLGLTDILLIVLVVLIVIMAIIVAMRLMRS